MSGLGKHKNELGAAAALAAAAAAIYFSGGTAAPAVLGAAEAAGAGAAGAGAAGAGVAGANVGAGALTAGEIAALGGAEGANVGAGSLLAANAGSGLLGANEGATAMGMLGANEGAAGLLGSSMPEAVATGFEVGGPGIGYAEEMGSGGPTTLADQAGTMWGNFSYGGGAEKANRYAKLANVTNGLLNPPARPAPQIQSPQRPQLAPQKLPPLYQDDTEEKRRQYQQWLAMQQGRGFYG